MAAAIRYRTGVDRRTGKLLTGWPHVVQSLEVIWLTRLDTRVMRLEFGSELFSFLAEDLTPATALAIYDALVTAAHRWEPEYRIRNLQLVSLTKIGGLGLRHDGDYYPEGRLGNYDLVQAVGGLSALQRVQQLARVAA